MRLAEEFAELVRQKRWWTGNEKVLIAVSGGVDSVVLLHLTANLPSSIRPEISVAHVDHQLRPASKAEKQFVQQLAQKYRVPCYVHTWNKEDHPTAGTENAARQERYAFFDRIMTEQNIPFLLTGHHKGDQAETVLMKIVRGSSLKYLGGILETRPFHGKQLIRPMLKVSKSDLYAYAEQYSLVYKEDESNRSEEYTRNRYRNTILPLLIRENKEVETHLADFADDLKDVLSAAEPMIKEKAEKCLKYADESILIFKQVLTGESDSMQRLILKRMLDQMYADTEYQYKRKHIELLQEWITSAKAHSTVDLPGEYAGIKEYEKLRIIKKTDLEPNILTNPITVEIGEWKELPGNREIGLFYSDQLPDTSECKTELIVFDLDDVELPLKVRHRQNGDKIQPKGMKGSKKIQRIMIDQKVSLSKRSEVIILEDAKNQILWVVGLKKSGLSRPLIPDRIQYVLIIKE